MQPLYVSKGLPRQLGSLQTEGCTCSMSAVHTGISFAGGGGSGRGSSHAAHRPPRTDHVTPGVPAKSSNAFVFAAA